jgi:hypothetical protein
MTDGFARAVARSSARMQKRRGCIVMGRDARKLLVWIESDEVFVFGVICLCRTHGVISIETSTYLGRYTRSMLDLIGRQDLYSVYVYVSGSVLTREN